MVLVNCLTCGKEFKTYPSRIKRGGGKFCSNECSQKSQISSIIKECEVCSKEFKAPTYRIKRGGGRYCSRKCFYEARTNKIIKICPYCGKEFKTFPSYVKRGYGKFCSKECYKNSMKNTIIKKCGYCGKEFKTFPSHVKRGYGKFCSLICRDKFNRGENSRLWKGGTSFEPYCSKFNNEFKERVRGFWNHTCGICGISEGDNQRKLDVHHVNYEKMVCCDDTPPLFIPLCRSCHIKTNTNRASWEYILTDYIMIFFDGESYLTM